MLSTTEHLNNLETYIQFSESNEMLKFNLIKYY